MVEYNCIVTSRRVFGLGRAKKITASSESISVRDVFFSWLMPESIFTDELQF